MSYFWHQRAVTEMLVVLRKRRNAVRSERAKHQREVLAYTSYADVEGGRKTLWQHANDLRVWDTGQGSRAS